MLELFACTIQTREHESVVVVKPRPKRIFEALGLIGLTPGHPIRYDEKTRNWKPPTGELVSITVKWTDNGRSRRTHIGQWMRPVGTNKPLKPQSWVFAGSFTTEGGTFTADADGTVISVVDFPSALIAFPGQKSADNDMLWLEAHSDAVPPLGTDVTLIVTPAVAEFVIELVGDERLKHNGDLISIDDLDTRFASFHKAHSSHLVVNAVVVVRKNAAKDDVDRIVRRLQKLLKDKGSVRVESSVRTLPGVDPSSPKDDSNAP